MSINIIYKEGSIQKPPNFLAEGYVLVQHITMSYIFFDNLNQIIVQATYQDWLSQIHHHTAKDTRW